MPNCWRTGARRSGRRRASIWRRPSPNCAKCRCGRCWSGPWPAPAGEVEEQAGALSGITVHIGARVAALAGSGEVLVTQTAREAAAGAGLRFTERGRHTLKGVPGEWTLFILANDE